jgi:flagellar basal-body rod protein FlgB
MDPMQPLDQNMHLLGKVLDLRAKKAEVIAANIANAETPGYSANRFDFEEDLARAIRGSKGLGLTTSHQKHIPPHPLSLQGVRGNIVSSADKTGIGDNNSVNVNQEMLDLSENQLLYETAAQLLKKKLGQLSYAISGGQ